MKVVIPMAGLGSRFSAAGYKEHKPLIKVNGKSLIRYSIESLDIKNAHYILVCRDLGGTYITDLKFELDMCNIKYDLKIIDRVTTGAAETALLGLEGIDSNEQLIITNCDQYLEWDVKQFLLEAHKYDGAVLTYKSDDPKNSFACVFNNKVTNLVEKKAVSDKALVGVHFWKSINIFKKSAEALLHNFDKARETYVSETYNVLIEQGMAIGAINIEPGRYWSTGTPADLAVFKGMMQEYHSPKNNTFFLDLDGTILRHSHKYGRLTDHPELCPGVREALDEIDSRGDTIILVSARKESARKLTEKILEDLMVPYDQLILGVSQGKRIVVNDVLTPQSKERAGAVNVITDSGWSLRDIL